MLKSCPTQAMSRSFRSGLAWARGSISRLRFARPTILELFPRPFLYTGTTDRRCNFYIRRTMESIPAATTQSQRLDVILKISGYNTVQELAQAVKLKDTRYLTLVQGGKMEFSLNIARIVVPGITSFSPCPAYANDLSCKPHYLPRRPCTSADACSPRR